MFKHIGTFIKRSMKKGNTMKTQIAPASFIVALSFGVALLLMFTNVIVLASYYFARIPLNHEHRTSKNWQAGFIAAYYDRNLDMDSFLYVNAPESFKEFLDKENADEFFTNSFEEFDAQYDFITYSKLMRKHKAVACIVFPEDSDAKLEAGEKLEVLTYFRTDKNDYADANLDLEDILDLYNNYLTTEAGLPAISVSSASVELNGIESANYDGSLFALLGFIPLLVFIAVLYSIMTAGTNAIAGEKERGTFAAIILTPTPRSSIVIGNVLGTALLAFLPGAGLTLVAFLFTPRKDFLGLVIALLLIASFAILMSSITILISIINQSIVTAQTAFLPIFLLVLAISVNCVQKLGIFERVFEFFPLYGHFFGLGSALTAGYGYRNDYWIGAIICIVISIALSCGVMVISTNLLSNEKFMTNSGGMSQKDLKKSNKPQKDLGLGLLANHLIFPLVTLSFAQILALIPTAITYMRNNAYTDFIASLKDVSDISGIVGTMSNVMAMFMSSPVFLITMTLGYVVLISIYCLRIRIFEKNRHPLQSMGLTGPRTKALKLYAIGLILGFGLLTCVCLILVATGNLRMNGIGLTPSSALIVLCSLPMWFIQGASEEIMFRGFMIPRVKARFNMIFAVIFSSFLFSLLHGANIGFTWLAGINLFIIAVFFALLYIYTDSLWLTCAAHTAWNFCQGNLYGLEVSGSTLKASVFDTAYTSSAKDLMTGGAFGPEGGLAVTIVTVIGIAIVSALLVRKNRLSKKQNS